MLAQFARKYSLEHVLAVQKDNELAKYYSVESIPAFVLIDRLGKIRLVTVGASSNTFQDIEDMLQQLLGQPNPVEEAADKSADKETDNGQD